MPDTGCQVTLLLPGLFGPVADPDIRDDASTRASEAGVLCTGLELPNLVRALSRSQQLSSNRLGPSLEALYLNTFEITLPADQDFPIAALTAQIDGLESQHDLWMRADPVYLRPDLGRLILHDHRRLDIQPDEAQQLASELNAEFEELELLVASPERWYLRLTTQPKVTSTSPATAHGQDADSCLLQGADARYWHQLQNEIQMLLHASEVNSAREARGLPAINSLWFWGVGQLPAPSSSSWDSVLGNDVLHQGLAHWNNTPYIEIPDKAQQWLDTAPAGACLVTTQTAARGVHDQDRDAWREALIDIDQHWLGPLLKALNNRLVETLTIDGGNGRMFMLKRRDARKWWRSDKSLQDLFTSARAPIT